MLELLVKSAIVLLVIEACVKLCLCYRAWEFLCIYWGVLSCKIEPELTRATFFHGFYFAPVLGFGKSEFINVLINKTSVASLGWCCEVQFSPHYGRECKQRSNHRLHSRSNWRNMLCIRRPTIRHYQSQNANISKPV